MGGKHHKPLLQTVRRSTTSDAAPRRSPELPRDFAMTDKRP